ncbi:MAG: hypothetical protein ACI4T1_03185 [Christensenellales bacterium]
MERIRTYEDNKKKIVYDNVIDITHTYYEGRQKIFRNLVQNHSLSENEYGVLLDCKSDIEDGKIMSGKPCVNVIIENGNVIMIF